MAKLLSSLVNPPSSTGGSIAVLEEGVQKSSGLGSLNIVGAAVTNVGGDVTVTIPVLAVGTTPPATPAIGDLWVDTN